MESEYKIMNTKGTKPLKATPKNVPIMQKYGMKGKSKKKCPKCGKTIPASAKACSYCGYKVSN